MQFGNYTSSEIAKKTLKVVVTANEAEPNGAGANEEDFPDSQNSSKVFLKVGKLSPEKIEKYKDLWSDIKNGVKSENVSENLLSEIEQGKSRKEFEQVVLPAFERVLDKDKDFCQKIQGQVENIFLENLENPKIFDEKEREKNSIWHQISNVSLNDQILLVWLFVLIIISMLAVGGTFSALFEATSEGLTSIFFRLIGSNRIVKLNHSECPKNIENTENTKLPRNLLSCYIQNRYAGKFIEEIPPIARVIDSLSPKYWHSLPEHWEGDKDIPKGEYTFSKNDYKQLFEIIEKYLIALSTDYFKDISDLTISTGILPDQFRPLNIVPKTNDGSQEPGERSVGVVESFKAEDKPLPIEAKSWIILDRKRRDELRLVDTFFLVLMLGVLGSLIFLVREHMTAPDNINTRLYFYRPLFGMLLAIGSFVITISISGIFSEGKSSEINVESVITIAFASGLISDAVYKNLVKSSQDSIGGRKNS